MRSVLHRMGYRFRLHRRDLPGRPDIVLPKHRTVVLVHGCFWHRHRGCRLAYSPKSQVTFWATKFGENVERDKRVASALRRRGWRVITVWECESKVVERLGRRLNRLLRRGTAQSAPTNRKAAASVGSRTRRRL